MVFTGFTWFCRRPPSDNEVVFSSSVMLSSALRRRDRSTCCWPIPTGELRTRGDRWMTGWRMAITTLGVGPVLYVVIDPVTDDCDGCPDYVLRRDRQRPIARRSPEPVIATLHGARAARAACWSRSCTPVARGHRPQRRILGPIYATGAFMLLMLACRSSAGPCCRCRSRSARPRSCWAWASFTLLPLRVPGRPDRAAGCSGPGAVSEPDRPAGRGARARRAPRRAGAGPAATTR